jgi:hypothetical protein
MKRKRQRNVRVREVLASANDFAHKYIVIPFILSILALSLPSSSRHPAVLLLELPTDSTVYLASAIRHQALTARIRSSSLPCSW